MRNKILKKLSLSIIMLLAVLLVAAASTGLFLRVDNNLLDVDYVSVERFMEVDGTVAKVYGSGDQFYNYLHDEKGRLLIPEDGYLYYAKAKAGRPVSTGVRWNASERAVLTAGAMTAKDLDLENNKDLLNNFGELDAGVNLAAVPSKTQIANNIIFLRFQDEPEYIITQGVFNYFSNESGKIDTLGDYFENLSNGEFGFFNVLPYMPDGEVFIYTAPNTKSYYRDVSAAKRNIEEGKLLGAALAAAKPYLQTSITENGLSTDTDGDGNVDSITFMVLSDEPGNDAWNTLLWPHQWNMGSIYVSDTISGAKADNYCFLFTSTSRLLATLTHEMGHVLGAPDLYHYKNEYDPIAFYDNMGSSSQNTPNYWLTAMREKYLADVVKDWQVAEITENWDQYTLKAVSTARLSDTLAYKIRLSATEWLYLEYRMPNVGRYDNNFNKGSINSVRGGLVAYRVTDGVYGNANALAPTGLLYASNPDEICVYRKDDIKTAALTMSDPTLGSRTNKTLYKNGNIFAKNGANSGIVVTVKDVDTTNNSVRFEVYKSDFPDYSGGSVESAIVGLTVSPDAEESNGGRVIETPYNTNPELSVYPIFLSGTKKYISNVSLPANLFSVSGFSSTDKSLLPQAVTLTFLKAQAISYGYSIAEDMVFENLTFKVRVVDFNTGLSILNLSQTEFLLGTESGFVADWKITTAMGSVAQLFNLNSAETSALIYEGIDGTKVGLQSITVKYGTLETKIDVRFFDTPLALVYAGEPTYLFGKPIETLPFYVLYQSGTKENVTFTTEELGFSTSVFGKQSVTATQEIETKTLTCETFVTVYKIVSGSSAYSLTKNKEKTPSSIEVQYASVLNLEDYELKVNFKDEAGDEYLSLKDKQTAPNELYTYDRTIDFVFNEVFLNDKPLVIKLRVTVPIKANADILSFRGLDATVDYANGIVVLKKAMTTAELLALVRTQSHLRVDIVAVAENGSASGATVTVVNATTGDAVPKFCFKVLLKGDANFDGMVDKADIDTLAKLYLADDSAEKGAIGDKNGDGVFRLEDFTLWLNQLNGKAQNA